MKRSLLVLELWGLGDLAIATPFLQAASWQFRVTLVARPYAADLRVRFWPGVRVVPFTAPWTAFRRKYRLLSWPWREFIRVRRDIAGRFDVGLSARWDPRDHFLLAFSGARFRIGYPRVGSRIFLTHPVARPAPGAHRYEHWRELGERIGLNLPPRSQLQFPQPRGGTVLVHTGAGQAVRVWPLPRYLNLVGRLRESGYQVQVASDPGQQDWWRQNGEKDIAAPTTVTELLSLIDRAGAFIGNDSGPGHLAAISGVPTLTLFGPQLPLWFVPLNPMAEWITGGPCPFKPCSDNCRMPAVKCLLDLTEDEVWARVDSFVARRLAGRAAAAAAAGTASSGGVLE